MPNLNKNIQNTDSFIRVREVLAKNNSILGKTTLTVFIALGLLALASPIALPSGIAALGIGAIGIFLDQVTQDNLSENEILQGVQKIIEDNGLLDREDFYNYMAPYYTKLLQINEKLESFATKEDLIKEIDLLHPELQKISQKIELLVSKEYLDNAFSTLYKIIPLQVPEEKLKLAQDNLSELPVDKIPEPSVLPVGSRFPNMRPNPRFVGHEEDLKQLANWFKGNNIDAIGQVAALTGMGGVGKTQVAVEFVHRYGQYFNGGVFWLNFDKPELVPSEVAACGNLEDTRPLEIRVKSVLAEWQCEMPRLLIFDNCEEFNLLKLWLPPTGGSRVIITSQQKNIGLDFGIKQRPIETLLRPQSISLLRSFREDLTQNDPNLDAIARELGDLPLALHMAGNYLRSYRHDFTPAEYLEELLKSKLIQHGSLKHGGFSPTGHELDIGRTFAISMERLDQSENDQLTLQIMIRVACFAPGVLIPRELLKKSLGNNIDGKQFSDGVTRLFGLGLVGESENGDIWMHRLVSRFVQETNQEKKAVEDVERAVTDAASQANNGKFPALMQPILPHLRDLTDKALSRRDRSSALLTNNLGYHLFLVADYVGARLYYEKSLSINIEVYGVEHPSTAVAFNNLGEFFREIGDYANSRLYLEQSLAIMETVFGEDHIDTAKSLSNLATVLFNMGDFQDARLYLDRALVIVKKEKGEDHPDIIPILNILGILLETIGDSKGARESLEQALAISKKVYGEDHPDTATCLSNLGLILQSTGDINNARKYYEKALVINIRIFGEDHPSSASCLNNLGLLLNEIGDYTGAKPYFEQTLAIHMKLYGKEHPTTATILNNLGLLFTETRDFQNALIYLNQALVIRKKLLGQEHPDTLHSLKDLGSLYMTLGDYVSSQTIFEQVLAIQKKVFGEEHPDTANTLNILGFLLDDMSDYTQARQYFEQALAVNIKIYGEEHPKTITSINNLGSLLLHIRDYIGARQHLVKALVISRKVFGEEHPITADSLNNLGGLLFEIGDYVSAKPYFVQALEINKKIFGENHPVTTESLNNLDSLLKKLE